MRIEDNEEEFVGRLYKVANKAIKKELDKQAEREGLDLAFWDYKLSVELISLYDDFYKKEGYRIERKNYECDENDKIR
jgi:hypothetical protein